VGAPARIEGAVQRVVAAPMDGFLHKSHVRPGDTVRAGDLLAELADQDLVLEQRRWEGALAQHENGYAAALARADRSQFVITQGKAGEAQAQLELVRQQLARTRLMAPIDGVVIKGDLSQSLGAPVQRGNALMTLAPAERYRLIVEVDERDIASVKPGQTGQLALASLPAETMDFVVERVTPVAAVRDGRNAFEVEARLLNEAPLLRPGLEGVAKIAVGERPAAWIWGHRGLDWLRLALWSWMP
jgi:multidrug resistance efflux pump